MSRYYPGFLTALFLILLRIAIGWHFLYEGLEKVESRIKDRKPFSAEIYLRNATGPLGPSFRALIPDVDGVEVLDPDLLKATWAADVEDIAKHYGFTAEQRERAKKLLDEQILWSVHWFDDPANAEKKQKYLHDLDVVEKTEHNPDALSFDRERAWDERPLLEADRRALTKPILEQQRAFEESIVALATPEQAKGAGPVTEQPTTLELLNVITPYGLVAIGICLMLGFLTPWAAVGAALFLAMIYLSMPPWPGLPPNPKAEGHYWIVSKNLVEMLACLVLATTPTGHWVGLDALVFGASRRRRLARAAAKNAGPADQARSRPNPIN